MTLAVVTGLLTALVTFLLVGFVGYSLWGCDEGPCPSPTLWELALRWGLPFLTGVSAGLWSWRKRLKHPPELWR